MKILDKKNKVNILEILLMSVAGFLIITFNKFSFCQQAYEIGFDQQVFLYWDYLRSLNLIPIKDYFYPYGLLLHFKSLEYNWYLLYLLIILGITSLTFLGFKKLFVSRIRTYAYYFIYSLFIFLFVNPDTYIRYSPLVIFSFLISYFAFKKRLFSKISGVSVGLSIGLFFSFVNDIFFYAAGLFFVFTIFYIFLNKNEFRLLRIQGFYFGLFGVFGFLIGATPLMGYLYASNSIQEFIFYFSSLGDFYQLAKVAFPPSLKNLENILVILSLIFSGFYLLGKYKKTLDFKFYIVLSLSLVILFLEQKNLVRSMYEQISFISLIIFFILINDNFLKLKNKFSSGVTLLFVLNFIFLLFLVVGFDRNFNFDKGRYSFSERYTSQCVDKKLKNIDEKSLSSHNKVVDYVNSINNSKIFSFPADPIFYVLLKQKPPYYPSLYEATPVYAQEKLIKYIDQNQVRFVIINSKTPKIQDNVPNELRGGILYKYILRNFTEIKRIDGFIILRINISNDR